MDTSFTRRNNYKRQNDKNNNKKYKKIGDEKTWKKYIKK